MEIIYLLSALVVVLTTILFINQKKSKGIVDNLNNLLSNSNSSLLEKDDIITKNENSINLLQDTVNNQNETIKNFTVKYESVLDIEELVNVRMNEISSLDVELKELNDKYLGGLEIYKTLERQLSIYNDEIEVMDFGLYKPQFDYATSEEFKQKIEQNYLKQKAMISDDTASVCQTEWTVNGNKAEGRKMTKLNKKNMLYAFNGECDALIAKVKWNNATKSIERLEKAYESINKLGAVNNITLSYDFYQLKKQELALVHEYENKKQDEKEEQRRIREQMREEEKVQRDIDRAQREAEEDEKRYQKALQRVKEDLRYASKDELDELNSKLSELQLKLKEAGEKKQRALSMAQLTRAGHIYIISNIGSFGEDVYKIGMTRRLEPLDRVRELSDASVPFRYDVHAVIYSDDAPKLEQDLHKKFTNRRINRVNGRKEFFKVSLLEIESFVKEHANAEIEFTQLAEAQEYRETMLMLEAIMKESQEETTIIKEEKFPLSLI
jgi:hypothetical protein